MGLKVCVLEASEYIGGTSAWSGGWIWIPQNHLAKAAGIADSCRQVLTYLRSVDGPTGFTQIWPYESANARAEARAKSVADGNWPSAGAQAFLRTEVKLTLAIPMAF